MLVLIQLKVVKTSFNNEKVTFFFNDLAHNKKKTYLTMDIEKFVQQILIHINKKIGAGAN